MTYPFNRVPKVIWGVVFGTPFEASATGIRLLPVQNTTPELLQIGPIVSVCLSVVCLFHTVFRDPFLEQVDGRTAQFSEK